MIIAVIGAGPAGSHYASLAAKKHEVHLFEAKRVVGKPVACTGILTTSAYSVTDIPKDLIVARITKFRVRSPEGKSITLNLDKENVVLDRARFDQHLALRAVSRGAFLHKSWKFTSLKRSGKGYLLSFENGSTFYADRVVGADGPHSVVAKLAGMYGKREFLQGLQARVRGSFEPGTTDVLYGIGEFAWIVPESKNIARVGVIGRNVDRDYDRLIKPYKVLEDQSGIVPLYNPKQVLQRDNISLIGDAATQVKPTTYGGIIYGLLAGKFLAEEWSSYPKAFNKKLGRDLWISLKMREAMNKFEEKDCNDLIRVFEKESNKKILEQFDRDFPSKFIVQLLLKEAKLWKLGFKLFR